jgi:hypothetical protein
LIRVAVLRIRFRISLGQKESGSENQTERTRIEKFGYYFWGTIPVLSVRFPGTRRTEKIAHLKI